ncbi:MAG TPA: GNAT family N-acetyltransferase [Roseiarcus sp.]|nr:GNAT family N-acetyltransferase [Roseiarcus sp.]
MTFALASVVPRADLACPFASVEVCGELAAAREAWGELGAAAGAYQTYGFAQACAAAFGGRLAIVVARDEAGRLAALLPLQIARCGPLKIAGFLGGSWANYHMGLFRPGANWCGDDVAALLRQVGRSAGVDLFAFASQPLRWEGLANPLAQLPCAPAPSPAFASALPANPSDWLDARFSRASQKKLRKKARKLEAFGALAYVRAGAPDEAARFLDAFLAHKAAQARARRARDPFARPQPRDLLSRLAASGAMEMHALKAGERIVAVFGALPGGRRLSGLVVSYDGDKEAAAGSPGEWLLIEVVRDAIGRGFQTFDLGVGESRYKHEICEIEERLFDTAFGVTPLGRAAAAAYLGGRAAMGAIKRRPRLFHLLQRLRGA